MRKYYKYELNMVVMNILSVVLFIVPIILIASSGYIIELEVINGLWFIGMLLYLMVHELFHGIGYSLFATDIKNIKYGIALEKGVLYAMCQERINKVGILVSLLFPLIFLTIIPLPIALYYHIDWLLMYAIINLGGAVGDIMMSLLIITAPNDIEYIDYNNDIGAYLISKHDLTKHKMIGFKVTETGEASKKKVDKSFKVFNITKPSLYIVIAIVLFGIINTIISLLR